MAIVQTKKIPAYILKITSKITVPKWPPKSDFSNYVLKFMKKNATEKQALKLMKTNKYFIRENCPFIYFGDYVKLTQGFVHQTFSTPAVAPYEKNFRIEELPNNLGIGGTLIIQHENLVSQFISKCVTCDLKDLFCNNGMWKILKISYDDFKFLTSSGRLKRLRLGNTIVVSNNGEIIPYETLFDHTPALRYFCLEYNKDLKMSQKFYEKICASNLEEFIVYELPENFEREAFLANMAKKPNLRVYLSFK
uniref:Uncharacterized protein n=1 Tax=Panagrolaimus sp. PS1159 TaxID=55785 RepID=A0AC35FWY1_9BILA